MIILTKKAYFELKHFVSNTDEEISGLGKSIIIKDKDILITDITIFKQENSFASTDLDQKALAQFLNEEMEKGHDISQWNVWWHSHADMSVFWSFTDEDTINNFTGGKYFVSLVANKKMEMLGRADIFRPHRFIIETGVVKPRGLSKKGLEEKIKQQCINKIKLCVKHKKQDFLGKLQYLIPKRFKNKSQSSEEETLEAQRRMDWQNWG